MPLIPGLIGSAKKTSQRRGEKKSLLPLERSHQWKMTVPNLWERKSKCLAKKETEKDLPESLRRKHGARTLPFQTSVEKSYVS